MRISIVGHCGSGKTVMAEMISKKCSIPHIHLDRFWFEAGGLGAVEKSDIEKDEYIKKYIREKTFPILGEDSWVSDGFYIRVIQKDIAERADKIIFLNIPLWRRLLNHASRIFHKNNRHTELNFWNEITFFGEIVRRTIKNSKKYNTFLAGYKGKVLVLRSRKEISHYIDSLN